MMRNHESKLLLKEAYVGLYTVQTVSTQDS